jgi:peptidoglycan/LPS O-acetylase OafA/YrhL
MLIVVVLLAPLLAPIGAGSATNATAAAASLFSANFYLYSHYISGYFATASTLNPLLHTWSLAVEEQFYLAIPAILFVVWRFTIRRTRISPITTARILVAAITLISLFACALMSWRQNVLPVRGLSFAYYSPFTRAWEFCFGLGLVLLPAGWAAKRPATRIALGILGYGGIITSALMFSESTNFPGHRAILPVAATALAILASAPTPRALRPMVFLGDNSYGWYLWHWPLIVFAGAFWSTAGATPLVIAAFVSLIPAIASRQLLERRLVPRVTRSQDTRSAVRLAVACIALPLLAIALSLPIISRTDAATDVTFAREIVQSGKSLDVEPCGRGIPLGPDTPNACIVNPDGATTIALIGDSNATQFITTLRSVAETLDARIEFASFNACPLLGAGVQLKGLKTTCTDYVRDTLDELRAHPRDVVIVGFATTIWLASPRYRTAPEGDEATLAADMSASLDAVIATGARTVLIQEVPKPKWQDSHWAPANCSALAAIIDIGRCGFPSFDPRSKSKFDPARRVEASIVASTGVELWNLDDSICVEHRCTQFVDGAATFGDNAHLSPEGAPRLTGRLLELLQTPRPSER